MPLYEHIFLGRHDLTQQQVEALTNQFSKIISDQGGKVVRTEYWGLKALAYKINKHRKAHYTMLHLDCAPAALAEMERQMRLSDDIVRHMSLKVEEHEKEPSIMMRKPDRDERRPGRGERPARGERPHRSDGPRHARRDRD